MMTDHSPTTDSLDNLAGDLPATLTYQGHAYALHEGRILLNWRDRRLAPRPRPCRYCRHRAFFTDDDGRPVHKTCHEVAITADLLTSAGDAEERAA